MDYNNNAFELEAVEDDPTYVTTVSYTCNICGAHIKAKKSHKHQLKNPKCRKKHEPTGRPVGRPYGTCLFEECCNEPTKCEELVRWVLHSSNRGDRRGG